jgi:hypothetical protein
MTVDKDVEVPRTCFRKLWVSPSDGRPSDSSIRRPLKIDNCRGPTPGPIAALDFSPNNAIVVGHHDSRSRIRYTPHAGR